VLDAMKNKKKKNMKWRMLQGIGILAIIGLVVAGIPGAEAYDGIQGDGKYFWNAIDTAFIQNHEEHSVWSVKYSDAIVDGYGDEKDWGEIRFDQRNIYAEPIGQEREIVGHVEPYVHLGLPTQAPGQTDYYTWEMLITFVVWQTTASYVYTLDGFATQYTTTLSHEIDQVDEGYEFEIGGTNAQAPSESAEAQDYLENVYDYGLSKAINHDEIGLAIDMIRTYAEGQNEPSWEQENDHRAGREKIEYNEEDDTYAGRYMVFWEQITLVGPDNPPEDTFLRIEVDGFATEGTAHIIDFQSSLASWELDISVTDELEDGNGGGGGGGGGGWPPWNPIPTGEY